MRLQPSDPSMSKKGPRFVQSMNKVNNYNVYNIQLNNIYNF